MLARPQVQPVNLERQYLVRFRCQAQRTEAIDATGLNPNVKMDTPHEFSPWDERSRLSYKVESWHQRRNRRTAQPRCLLEAGY